MTLRLSAERAQRALPTSASNANQIWNERAALLIRVEDPRGSFGLGECSPLPGFSRDTLGTCESALGSLSLSEIPERVPRAQLRAALTRAGQLVPQALPALRCALETALLDLWSRALSEPAWRSLRAEPEPPAALELAGLLSDLESALSDRARAAARGIKTLKLKIGRPGAWPRELALAQALRAADPTLMLRLDANQAFSAQDRERLRALAGLELDFLEEPGATGELAALGDLGLPLALDESLAGLELDAAESLCSSVPNLRAIVLKPMLHGITRCLELARRAHARGVRVVLSHTFDGAPALAASAALALAVGSPDAAHGLDPIGARWAGALPGFGAGTLAPWSEPGLAVRAGGP